MRPPRPRPRTSPPASLPSSSSCCLGPRTLGGGVVLRRANREVGEEREREREKEVVLEEFKANRERQRRGEDRGGGQGRRRVEEESREEAEVPFGACPRPPPGRRRPAARPPPPSLRRCPSLKQVPLNSSGLHHSRCGLSLQTRIRLQGEVVGGRGGG